MVVVLAAALQVVNVLVTAAGDEVGMPLTLIHPGADGPSAEVVAADFDEPLPPGIGHDGQQFYAIARDPWHPDDVADHLDRPRYRLQRPLLPVLAWALQPTGGGPGLVWAMFAVNVAALVALGLALVRLTRRFRAPALLPAVLVLLPLGYWPLRISTSDVLALALLLWATDAHLDRRPWRAAAWGALAALARESSLLVLAGLWLIRRDRASLPVVAVPAAVVGALFVALRLVVDVDSPSVVEFEVPFVGLWDSYDLLWRHGEHLTAAVVVLGALLLGALALATPAGRRHPLAPALALQLAFTVVLDVNVLGLAANGPRTTAPLQVLAALVLTSASVRRPDAAPDDVTPRSAAPA